MLCEYDCANSGRATTGSTQATQSPISGRPQGQGTVSVVERTTSAGGGYTVNSIDSSVTVLNSFAVGTPNGAATDTVVQLTLESALSRGLRFNLAAVDQTAALMQAQGQGEIARSGLLPEVNTDISEDFERLNLREMGIESSTFPETAKLNYYDARAARLKQTVFDLVKVENLRNLSHDLHASIQAARHTGNLVVLAVAGPNLQVIVANARVAAATAQVEGLSAGRGPVCSGTECALGLLGKPIVTPRVEVRS